MRHRRSGGTTTGRSASRSCSTVGDRREHSGQPDRRAGADAAASRQLRLLRRRAAGRRRPALRRGRRRHAAEVPHRALRRRQSDRARVGARAAAHGRHEHRLRLSLLRQPGGAPPATIAAGTYDVEPGRSSITSAMRTASRATRRRTAISRRSSAPSSTTASLIAGGARFDGTSAITLADSPTTRVLPSQGVTISTWVRHRGAATGRVRRVGRGPARAARSCSASTARRRTCGSRRRRPSP